MTRHDEAIREARQAQQVDPLSLSMGLTSGVVLCFARRYDRAIEELRKVLDMDANFAAAHSTIALAYTYRNMCDEAVAEYTKASALARGSPEMEMNFNSMIACSRAICGRSEEAQRFLAETNGKPGVSPYALAVIHAHLGEHEIAMDLLERAYDERNVQMVGLKVDPALDPVRSLPRFQTLLERIGLAG
jgi:tetratricopeptide (TPR) repeat protein